jgi:FemAB-related protein (PEP-CTERM system-associated)
MSGDSTKTSAHVEPDRLGLATRVLVCTGSVLAENLPRWTAYLARRRETSLSRHPAWLGVLAAGLKHRTCSIEATVRDQIVGLLPLAYVNSLLFGRFLVSLPYLNTGGVLADDARIGRALVDEAVALADRWKVRYLELRHEQPLEHPAFTAKLTSKVHMRLNLPDSSEELWKQFASKVRSHVRQGEKHGFTIHWGSSELLPDFYAVFAHNMRDLGTPVFSQRLFAGILSTFREQAELCVVRLASRPIAAALLLHGLGVTEVPSASSLHRFNNTNANSLMYWHLLRRAVQRGQQVFDFGRSSLDSNTYVFKKQWGAKAEPATWQYYVRRGSAGDMRRESGNYARLVAVWRWLPVPLSRLIGPAIVRGIP